MVWASFARLRDNLQREALSGWSRCWAGKNRAHLRWCVSVRGRQEDRCVRALLHGRQREGFGRRRARSSRLRRWRRQPIL